MKDIQTESNPVDELLVLKKRKAYSAPLLVLALTLTTGVVAQPAFACSDYQVPYCHLTTEGLEHVCTCL